MNKIFENGKTWLDINGNIIHAHGGHIVNFGGVYYWYGENRMDNAYVSCYASRDLLNWEFRNNILTSNSKTYDIGVSSDLSLLNNGKKVNIERPKVVYNEKTKNYVMWAHYENGVDYAAAAACIATCDTPDGDFTYHGYFRPLGFMSRDCNVFEFEGDMYFISASNHNKDLHVYLMADNYLGVKERVNLLFEGESREAPAPFIFGDKIYMLTSQCTGWKPNRCGYSFASSFRGNWEKVIDFGDETTYRTQPTSVLELLTNGKRQYIYISDRWGGSEWNIDNENEFDYFKSSYYFSLFDISKKGVLSLLECEKFTIDINKKGFQILE